MFLEAVKYVKEHTNRKIRAFIVGDGEERQVIEATAAQLGLDFTDAAKSSNKAILTFTSWIKDVDRVCAGADIVALTSHNEGTPVSLIEAQAANRPVVSTDVGGIGNVVIRNKTGLLSTPGDLGRFAENLLQLVEDEGMRLEMSRHGWLHVKEKFHYTRLVSDMKNLYSSLLSQKNR
jgi:glycosyltransferase involved in cell wall biosynthesis